jgi:hypothetical protein
MGEKGGEDSRSESRFRFWRDAPGWVQASAAVLALLGVGGVAGGVAHSVASAHRPPHKTTGTSPSSVRWHGPIAINSSGIELDDVPPMTGATVFTFTNSGGYLLSGNGSYAIWQSSSAPTYSQCRTLVQTQGSTSSLHLTSSLDLCVRTGAGRTAYVKITSLSSDGSTAQAQATIWTQ